MPAPYRADHLYITDVLLFPYRAFLSFNPFAHHVRYVLLSVAVFSVLITCILQIWMKVCSKVQETGQPVLIWQLSKAREEVDQGVMVGGSHASKISKTNCCMSHGSEVYIQQQSFTSTEVILQHCSFTSSEVKTKK